MKTRILFFVAISCMLLPGSLLFAADQDRDQTRDQIEAQDQDRMIYGWELMTVMERNEHHEKMMNFKTEQERSAYLEEHHKLMQQRARDKGVEIPDRPMMYRPGMTGSGPGNRPGSGSGKGK